MDKSDTFVFRQTSKYLISMKRLTSLLFICSSICVMAQNTDQKIEEMSADFLKHLQKAEYNDAANFFDNSLKIDGAKLQDVWTKLNGQLGAIQRTEPSYVERANEVRTVFTPIAFERASLDMKLSFNSSDKVVGFFFAPHVNHDPYVVPAYVNMNAVTEKPLNIETGQFTLSGKLALPKNTTAKAPVVILVHGSGPNDMDEGIGPNKVFKDQSIRRSNGTDKRSDCNAGDYRRCSISSKAGRAIA
jgi:hypothetical protein